MRFLAFFLIVGIAFLIGCGKDTTGQFTRGRLGTADRNQTSLTQLNAPNGFNPRSKARPSALNPNGQADLDTLRKARASRNTPPREIKLVRADKPGRNCANRGDEEIRPTSVEDLCNQLQEAAERAGRDENCQYSNLAQLQRIYNCLKK